MAIAPFVVDTRRSGLAIAYRNEEYIADRVLPRVPVPGRKFDWDNYSLEEAYTVPDTRVGRLSRPNQVVFSATRELGECQDFALDAPVPRADIENAASSDGTFDPLDQATEMTSELILLDREVRAASLVFSLNTYLSTQRITLSGVDQFTNTASRPKDRINTALDSMLIRANTMIVGQIAWTALRNHPQIVESIRGTGADEGSVSAAEVAELFELREVIVGRGFQNIARRGQVASFQRLWGGHIALLHQNPMARPTGAMVSFGMTAEFGNRIAATMEDPNIGMRGGVMVRVGECVDEIITSNRAGYFIQSAA